MGRVLKTKDLVDTRLATNYGGWMYCTACQKNIGYLCYVTYDQFKLDYVCQCGNHGHAFLDFEDTEEGFNTEQSLLTIKNRWCCPKDDSPLFTMLDKNVKSYQVDVVCKACHQQYHQEKE